MGKYRKYLEFAALLLLAVAIIWWFGRRLDWVQVKLAVQRSDWRLILLGAGIVLLGYLWRAIRWQVLLAPLAKASLREIWIATTVGFGAILLIGRAGEVVRPVVLPMRDKRVRPAASFVTIMVERLYDTIAVVSIFALKHCWVAADGSAGRDSDPIDSVQTAIFEGNCLAGSKGQREIAPRRQIEARRAKHAGATGDGFERNVEHPPIDCERWLVGPVVGVGCFGQSPGLPRVWITVWDLANTVCDGLVDGRLGSPHSRRRSGRFSCRHRRGAGSSWRSPRAGGRRRNHSPPGRLRSRGVVWLLLFSAR